MISQTAVSDKLRTVRSLAPAPPVARLTFLWCLVVSAWCGLVAGLLEVGAIVLRKELFDADHLYKMSRHFIWLIPFSNLCVFLVLGLVGYVLVLVWPGRGRWLFTHGLAAMSLLPALLVAFPRIYGLAWLVVAMGIAVQLGPRFERRLRGFRRFLLVSFPVVVVIVMLLWASLWIGDRVKLARESARPLPPPGSPNVLLIVMDTVAAGHLSLHGYSRATSPTLVQLAQQGIRFDLAWAASSWTLPSHATMFTGRWMHELSTGWFTPLDRTHPTLAEFLGRRGYATAGFIANWFYCGTDSGLARGFTVYQDYIFSELAAFKAGVLVRQSLDSVQVVVTLLEDWLESTGLMPDVQRIWQALDTNRKGAAAVNRELLDWLSQRPQAQRPFFAFLNYSDAHHPYALPAGSVHRFGVEPSDDYQRNLIQNWPELDKTTVSSAGLAFAIDSYDDCIADLDEQLGILVDELNRRGVLEQTWLIIVSDHGESFGEHRGVYSHGTSLYETELRVPLLLIPPGGSATNQSVKEAVTLRDLPSTIVDVVGQEAGSPFPGVSLARFWKQPGPTPNKQPSPALLPVAEVVPHDLRYRDYWGIPKRFSPLGAVLGKDWSYIRREGDGAEELFRLSEDPKQQRNLAGDPSARINLEQMRRALGRLTGGPLLPERFNP